MLKWKGNTKIYMHEKLIKNLRAKNNSNYNYTQKNHRRNKNIFFIQVIHFFKILQYKKIDKINNTYTHEPY